jgi:lipoyl(octanoyl) transferase
VAIRHVDLGTMEYSAACRVQLDHAEEVLAAREAGTPEVGRLLTVEHPPVITVSSRPSARSNLIATPDMLARAGVAVANTDRGGDITYHGPGQLVVYPILDLNVLNLGLHAYMRLLEDAVIDACKELGIAAGREPGATGVWVKGEKICAMGVRVRRWVSMHGLALNVAPDLSHFGLIVPCGLVGRGITSIAAQHMTSGRSCPTMERTRAVVVRSLTARVEETRAHAARAREAIPEA